MSVDGVAGAALDRVLAAMAGPAARPRPDQVEAVEALVDGRRVLLVQATGWGKSAVYWAATAALREAGRGPALVISPLLALMRDQVAAAERAGLRAATVNSANVDDWQQVFDALGADEVDVLLVSRGRNLRTLFKDAFGRVLNRPVTVSIDSTVGLSYRGLDVEVRGNNSLAVYGKDDASVIFWRNGTRSFEIVFGRTDRAVSTYRSLVPYVAADVASPTVTKAEVDAWRRGSADSP